jgi:hypothetical protein
VRRFVQATSELSQLCSDTEVDAALVAQLDALDQQIRDAAADPASSSELLGLIAETRVRVAAASVPSD